MLHLTGRIKEILKYCGTWVPLTERKNFQTGYRQTLLSSNIVLQEAFKNIATVAQRLIFKYQILIRVV